MSRYPGSYSDNPGRNPDAGGGKLDATPSAEVESQAAAIANGVLAIPIDQALVSIVRWSSILGGWNDPALLHLSRSLKELGKTLEGPALSGIKVGVLLTRLGMETRTIAADRLGTLGLALDKLADALIFAGTSLAQEFQ